MIEEGDNLRPCLTELNSFKTFLRFSVNWALLTSRNVHRAQPKKSKVWCESGKIPFINGNVT